MKTKRNAFTMVELMIVIVIVAILAAVVTPMLRGRMEKAKWSEAMAGCSAIATAVRSWAAENSGSTSTPTTPTLDQLGFTTEDLDGKYFDKGNYVIDSASYNPATGLVTYKITVTGDGTGGSPTGTLVLEKTSTSDPTFTLTSGSGTSTSTTTF